MSEKLLHTIVVLMTVFSVTFGIHAEETESSRYGQYETNLLELINHAREYPLEVVQSLGIDTEKIMTARPELFTILEKGMGKLGENPKLRESAGNHCLDMLEKNASENSVSCHSFHQRILDAGYLPSKAAEMVETLVFANYIPPETAVTLLFNKMVADALESDATGNWGLFDPEFSEIGIRLFSGYSNMGGASRNAYVAIFDFASYDTDLFDVEIGLFEVVNMIRANPKLIGFADEEDQKRWLAFAENHGIFETTFPPYARSTKLCEIAADHNRDMTNRGYWSIDTPEGETPLDRTVSAGYITGRMAESIGSGVFDGFVNPYEAAVFVILDMIRVSLSLENPDLSATIFDTGFKEMGISFEAGVVDFEGKTKINYTMVIDYALPEATRNYMLGNVFADKNGNGVFDFGEGIRGLTVTAKSLGGSTIFEGVAVGPFGFYQTEAPLGFVELEISDQVGDVVYNRIFFGWQQAIWKDILIEESKNK